MRAAMAILGTCVAGCKTTASNTAPAEAASASSNLVLTGNWNLLELNSAPIRSGAVTLNLQPDGRFVATVYCNEARGWYNLQRRSLSFNGQDATERGCKDETAHVGAIGSALRGRGYTSSLDVYGDLLLTGPARLRLRRF